MQIGCDEPLVHSMQMNETPENIKPAFQGQYRAEILSQATDLNKLNNLKKGLVESAA